MMMQILTALKYWKIGGVVLLVLALLGSSYLAHRRGERLDQLSRDYATLRATHQAQLKTIATLKKKDTDRDEFEKLQQKSFRASEFTAAYERLRQRQAANRSAR